MAVYENGYYRISYSSYTLHAASSTSATLKTTRTGENNQFWHYENNKLKSELYPSYGIAGTSNVNMSTSPVSITINTYTTNKCYIERVSDGKYLAVSSGSLVWSTSKTYWTIERVYKQTGVPKYDPEYFSAESGMKDGAWNTYWTGYLKSFFSRLYGVPINTVIENNIGSCMYGAIYSSGPYKGEFHTGLDFYKGGVSSIKCPFEGEFLGYNDSYGCVYVYSSDINCTLVFMHMDIDSGIIKVAKNTIIDANTPMGLESNKAGSNKISQHLHIEVQPGKVTHFAPIPANSYDEIESITPYAAIYQVL